MSFRSEAEKSLIRENGKYKGFLHSLRSLQNDKIFFMFKLKKIIEYSLYLLAFILPWQTRLILRPGSLNGGYFEYGSVGLYGTDILLLIIFCLYILYLVKMKFSIFDFRFSNALFMIGGLELTVFVSIFFSEDKSIAVYKYIWLLMGIGLLFLLQSFDYKKIRLLYSFLLGVFFQAVLGIWHFLNQFAYAFKWLGIAEHDPSTLGVSVVEAIGADGIGERWLRAYGGLDHPNIFGGLLAIGVLVVIFLLIFLKRNIQYSEKNTQYSIFNIHSIYKYLILIFYFFLLTFCTALFFTFSRSAWLACAVGIVVMLIFGIIKKDWFYQRELLKIILFVSVLFFILFINFENLVLTRVRAQSRLEQISNIERMESYQNGFEIIKNNFFFGAGIGNYTMALEKNNPGQPAYSYQPVHNVFLLVLAEIGVFGFLFFVSLFLYVFYQAIKIKDGFAVALLIALMILMMFDHYFWSLHFGMMFLFFVVWLMVIKPPLLENK
ncbi:MAG: O-antigen ligase-related protein [Candidatus Falkowbacteria bacterium GW2011_GWC2_38_22]|uniref:O-antigen ligase-related protein n=1 Tax=Candidatus Falkowbacteria bacterium GW2011_GWE1_38_31 TaxID=1618638 RepID=A0A0G0MY39_9BACT|nr:MAG: O-antigen ligase-related protein [Candidatus Falkowbacteria bacterium GW2011_GWF2_38_1205]KKQ60906.1 MAG: O-antigen ligase-related protein [Candidatus Falkowbacteria bacterium GW2011_GWC2_38_22]KKQ63024.1 MAG: O-antigen ligase-related protein [Candidatus Falkowbacteria bacterium GW2011_GWF1_38_22]KKQ65046.1 MAG: O-antigen ligase-related protein [Candidatus Falkowbacteria bacterium GW2011_GWE2_38_254]KKQ69821.1 MAG: O-antigen ligase-related protein [Candidatus Falkowbacteria bacterium GW